MASLTLTDARYSRALLAKGSCAPFAGLFEKIRQGRPLVYASLGGSITEGASASKAEFRYVERFSTWLRGRFPGLRLKTVNAGIGASDSLFGSFRAQKDVLRHSPDIVTIEYAVNDALTPDLADAYEGLVRQCVAAPSAPLVVLLFLTRRDGGNAQEVHAPVGGLYGLPMLSYRDSLYPEVKSGALAWTEISPDEVHPNDAGHEYIAALLAKLLSDAEAVIAPSGSKPVALPEPLRPGSLRFMGGTVADASSLDVVSNNGWTKGPHKGGYLGFQSETPGSELVVRFKGRLAFIGCQKYAGNFGRASVSLDGGAPVAIEGFYEKPLIQAWAGGHTVLTKLLDGSSPAADHTLSIKLLEERHQDSAGHKFDFGYLLLS